MNVRWPSWLAAVSVVSVLGACTGGGEVAPTNPVSVSATTTTSTSPQPPSTASAPTTVTDEALAIAAVRRYYDELNKALRSRQSVELRKAFTAACSVCKEDAALIDQALAAGHTFEGPGFSVDELAVTGHQDGNRILVRGVVSLPPLTTRDAAGRVVRQSSGSRGQKDFSVFLQGSGWLIELVSR